MKSTGRPPAFLRVHTPVMAPAESPKPELPADQFWNAFSAATGWAMDPRSTTSKSKKSKNAEPTFQLVPAIDDGLLSLEGYEEMPSTPRAVASRLATSGVKLLDELERAKSVIRRQEVELASHAVPAMSPRVAKKLSDTLTKILRDGITTANCKAAAFYTLNDMTSELKLRARCGIPIARLQDPPRPLRGAMADLEALVSRVAVIERITDNPQWSSPEPWEAGMCASVLVDDLPIGTLWMWRSRAGRFGKAAQTAIRVAADRIALELQQAVARSNQRTLTKQKAMFRNGARWQHRGLPSDTPLAPDWKTAGWIDAPTSMSRTWHQWDVLPDGTLAVALGQALDKGRIAAALTSASLRAAWQAHAGYRLSPQQVIGRVSDTLWQTSSHPSEAALLYAKINPDSGEADIAWAGNIPVLIASRYGYRPVCNATAPLCSHPDLQPHSTHIRLEAGECLMIGTPGLFKPPGVEAPGRLSQQDLAGIVRAHLSEKPADILSTIRREIAIKQKLKEERALILCQHVLVNRPSKKTKRGRGEAPKASKSLKADK